MPLLELREALRHLCCSHGWSYGALWRPHRSDARTLLMDECYYEEEVRSIVDEMRYRVYLAGEGTVGGAAVSGKHQWIHSETCVGPSLTGAGDSLDTFLGDADYSHQFFSGIKTIAVISLQPLGAVQFGSSQKISESQKFVSQVRHMFRQLETMIGLPQNLDARKTMTTPDPNLVSASVISSGITISRNNNIRTSHENMSEAQLANSESSTDPSQPSSFRFSECHDGMKYHGGGMKPHVLPMPDMWDKEIASQPMLEQQKLFSEMTTQGFSSVLPTKSNFSFPLSNLFQWFGGGSGELCSPYGPKGDLLADNSFSEECSFVADAPGNLVSFHQDLAFEHSQSVHSKDEQVIDLVHLGDQQQDHLGVTCTVPTNDNLLGSSCVSSVLIGDATCSQMAESLSKQVENSSGCAMHSVDAVSPNMLQSDSDMFNGLEIDLTQRIPRHDQWDDIILPMVGDSCSNLTTSVPEFINKGSSEAVDKGFFSESSLEQLLHAVVAGNVNLSSCHSSDPSTSSSVAGLGSELQCSKTKKTGDSQLHMNQVPLVFPSLVPSLSRECNFEKIIQNSFREISKLHTSPWINDGCSMNVENSVFNQPKKPEETAKVARKRARPGESTRPRPKDRQQIQDRVKELREIVPNATKCSIDSLLDRTIKHMLFLQSVTQHAEKLRQADEPKMIGDKSGVVLKDNLSSSGGGATWAYEVAGHTMVCPLIIEDLNPPGQMLVEILCEHRGFFHEIADMIRGFGLTILKGVMEIHDSKIWARFLVEANRDVTRMDIFLSLIQLLQSTSCGNSRDQTTRK